MQAIHPIKASKRYPLLGWFVLFSLLAHGIFFAVPDSKKENRLAVQLSGPLQVTVLSSKSSGKPVQTTTPENSKNIAITKPLQRKLPDLVKPANNPDKAVAARAANNNATDTKPASNSDTLQSISAVALTNPVNDITATRTTKNVTLNHLQQQLQETIRARFTYPRMARRMGWEGMVGLSIHIENDGSLNQIRIAHSSGHKVLDDNARKTIQNIGRLQLASNMVTQAVNTEIEVLYRLTD